MKWTYTCIAPFYLLASFLVSDLTTLRPQCKVQSIKTTTLITLFSTRTMHLSSNQLEHVTSCIRVFQQCSSKKLNLESSICHFKEKQFLTWSLVAKETLCHQTQGTLYLLDYNESAT